MSSCNVDWNDLVKKSECVNVQQVCLYRESPNPFTNACLGTASVVATVVSIGTLPTPLPTPIIVGPICVHLGL